ncbi:hypothetical protein SETIT_2G243600v2 [Setaria italica]|uniref:Uncharacterized protein n=2 Tax=Setaria TaxID=4554 RepID=A0A368Q362_SETIT|nr:hypothetical protein SETIT_2G243600v2 [Setaria italica]TKW33660.1 hypothetical protein SEVIR_2G254000v2 [Setaria viridis]
MRTDSHPLQCIANPLRLLCDSSIPVFLVFGEPPAT